MEAERYARVRALFDAVAERWLAHVMAPLTKITADKKTPAPKRLKAWIRQLAETKRRKVLDDPEMFTVYTGITAEAHDVVAKHIEHLHAEVSEILRDGVKAHKLTPAGPYDADYYAKVSHVPNQVLKALFVEVTRLHRSGVISGEQLIVLNAELQSFADNLGACERIKKTPIPYAYSLFLKKIIFIYVFTMPVGFVLDYGYWAVPVVTFVFYAFASIEVIAEEIEDPFGREANDLPTDSISDTIRANLTEILS